MVILCEFARRRCPLSSHAPTVAARLLRRDPHGRAARAPGSPPAEGECSLVCAGFSAQKPTCTWKSARSGALIPFDAASSGAVQRVRRRAAATARPSASADHVKAPTSWVALRRGAPPRPRALPRSPPGRRRPRRQVVLWRDGPGRLPLLNHRARSSITQGEIKPPGRQERQESKRESVPRSRSRSGSGSRSRSRSRSPRSVTGRHALRPSSGG